MRLARLSGIVTPNNAATSEPIFYAPYYWSSPTAAPTAMPMPAGMAMAYARSISNAGAVVGTEVRVAEGGDHYHWASPAAAPTLLSVPAGCTRVSITKSGTLIFNVPSPERFFVATSPSGPRVQIQIPAGFTQVSDIFEGDDGVLMALPWTESTS